MKINGLTNLWVGYNNAEDFRVLICALDSVEAQEIANTYGLESGMEGAFEVSEFTDVDTSFDCDYVLTYSSAE